MITKIMRGLTILLLVLTRCIPDAAQAQPPLPVVKAVSPKVKSDPSAKNRPMAKPSTTTGVIKVVVGPQGKVITLAADFAPLTQVLDVALNPTAAQVSGSQIVFKGTNVTLVGLEAFIDVADSMTNPVLWNRFSLPYAPAGGTFAMPYTNRTGTVYWRAGYRFLATPP